MEERAGPIFSVFITLVLVMKMLLTSLLVRKLVFVVVIVAIGILCLECISRLEIDEASAFGVRAAAFALVGATLFCVGLISGGVRELGQISCTLFGQEYVLQAQGPGAENILKQMLSFRNEASLGLDLLTKMLSATFTWMAASFWLLGEGAQGPFFYTVIAVLGTIACYSVVEGIIGLYNRRP